MGEHVAGSSSPPRPPSYRTGQTQKWTMGPIFRTTAKRRCSTTEALQLFHLRFRKPPMALAKGGSAAVQARN